MQTQPGNCFFSNTQISFNPNVYQTDKNFLSEKLDNENIGQIRKNLLDSKNC